MKRFLIISALLGLFFASCSYDASDTAQTGTKSKQKNEDQKLQLFSFVLDEDFVTTVQKSSGISNSNSVTVRIEFTGGYEATDTKNLSFAELLGTSFNFTEIPLNEPFTVKILVYHGSVLKYEAIKEDIVLDKGGENDLSLLLKSVFDYADETKFIVWTGNQLYTSQTATGSLSQHPVDVVEVNKYFFDAPGNVWVFSMIDGYKLVSDEGKTIDLPMEEKDGKMTQYQSFTCAREFNILYGFGGEIEVTGQADSPKYIVTEFPKALTDLDLRGSFSFELKLPENIYLADIFTVCNDGDNDKVYALCSSDAANETTFKILEFDLNKAVDNVVNGEVKVNLSENLPEGIENPIFTDMLYQEGSVYVIVNDYNITYANYPIYSRGALLKCNLTGSVTYTGLAGKADKDLITGMYNYVAVPPGSDTILQLYSDPALTTKFVVEGEKRYNINGNNWNDIFPEIYAPLGLQSNYFYCPSKFIAIKPKKLVIADDGIAFYTNDDGALCQKNLNRVAYVDLENFAAGVSSSENVPVEFDKEAASLYTSARNGDVDDPRCTEDGLYNDSCSYISMAPDISLYFKLNDEFSAYSHENKFYLGIPVEE